VLRVDTGIEVGDVEIEGGRIVYIGDVLSTS